MILPYNTKLDRLGRHKHSSLFGLLVSYEENEVLWIWPRVHIHNASFSS